MIPLQYYLPNFPFTNITVLTFYVSTHNLYQQTLRSKKEKSFLVSLDSNYIVRSSFA